MHLPIFMCIYLLSIYLSIHLSLYPSMYLSTYLSVYLPIGLPAYCNTTIFCVLYFCNFCECLQHRKKKIAIIKHNYWLWEWLLVIINDCAIDVELERAVPVAVMDVFCTDTRANMVHTSLDCSVILAGKSQIRHGSTHTANQSAKRCYS